MKRSLYLSLTLLLFSFFANAQITAPQADGSDVTQYPVFPETDNIYIFCTSDSLAEIGSLTATTSLSGSKEFTWEKYNEQTASFELFSQEITSETTSVIQNLADGCYRITVTQGSATEIYRAWVFNDWTIAEGSVDNSNCESFELNGSFKTANLVYYDLNNNTPVSLSKVMNAEWMEGSARLTSQLNFVVNNPPTQNTEYSLRVYDQYGCDASSRITYESIVTTAEFSVDANWTNSSNYVGEAPLTVTFINESENGTSGYYEWFFYRALEEINQEIDETGGPVDSIMLVAYDDAPVYTYQNSGTYLVKLVSKHISELFTCVDTFTFENYIVVDTSSVIGANVFTPNGDGVNDQFVIKFQSMKSMEINIYNRWGKRVHYWKSGDIEDPDNARTESVWDGRIGGRYASPGVYYWDAYGVGRDGRKQSKHGFVHLFREK